VKGFRREGVGGLGLQSLLLDLLGFCRFWWKWIGYIFRPEPASRANTLLDYQHHHVWLFVDLLLTVVRSCYKSA